MFFLVLLYLALLALVIWVYLLITREFADIAQSKGYDRTRYWRISFWLGMAGDLIILALPDLNQRKLQQQMLEQLKIMNGNQAEELVQSSAGTSRAVSSSSFELPQL